MVERPAMLDAQNKYLGFGERREDHEVPGVLHRPVMPSLEVPNEKAPIAIATAARPRRETSHLSAAFLKLHLVRSIENSLE